MNIKNILLKTLLITKKFPIKKIVHGFILLMGIYFITKLAYYQSVFYYKKYQKYQLQQSQKEKGLLLNPINSINALNQLVLTPDEGLVDANEALFSLGSFKTDDSTEAQTLKQGFKNLNASEKKLVQYISLRFRVSPEAIAHIWLVSKSVGKQLNLEPTMLMGLMAVESSFNPIAASQVGAVGLMQILPSAHPEKIAAQNGMMLTPFANIAIGAKVIKEYIAQTQNVDLALRRYVGAVTSYDGVYGNRVLMEKSRFDSVLKGTIAPNDPRVLVKPKPAASMQDAESIPDELIGNSSSIPVEPTSIENVSEVLNTTSTTVNSNVNNTNTNPVSEKIENKELKEPAKAVPTKILTPEEIKKEVETKAKEYLKQKENPKK